MRHNVHRGRSRGRQRLALPHQSTTRCWCRWRTSRCFRRCRWQKHTAGHLNSSVVRSQCASSEVLEQVTTLSWVKRRAAIARVLSSDLRGWQLDGGRRRWPQATYIGQNRKRHRRNSHNIHVEGGSTLDTDSTITINLAKESVLASRLPVGFVLGDSELRERHCSFRQSALVGNFKFLDADGLVRQDVLSRFKSVTFDFKNSVLVSGRPQNRPRK
jgi:hypothetical protein